MLCAGLVDQAQTVSEQRPPDRIVRPTAEGPYEVRARYLRALFREHRPAAEFTDQGKLIIDQVEQAHQWALVRDEYQRLFQNPRTGELEHILTNVWIEARELRGERYDRSRQAWVTPDGTMVKHDRAKA